MGAAQSGDIDKGYECKAGQSVILTAHVHAGGPFEELTILQNKETKLPGLAGLTVDGFVQGDRKTRADICLGIARQQLTGYMAADSTPDENEVIALARTFKYAMLKRPVKIDPKARMATIAAAVIDSRITDVEGVPTNTTVYFAVVMHKDFSAIPGTTWVPLAASVQNMNYWGKRTSNMVRGYYSRSNPIAADTPTGGITSDEITSATDKALNSSRITWTGKVSRSAAAVAAQPSQALARKGLTKWKTAGGTGVLALLGTAAAAANTAEGRKKLRSAGQYLGDKASGRFKALVNSVKEIIEDIQQTLTTTPPNPESDTPSTVALRTGLVNTVEDLQDAVDSSGKSQEELESEAMGDDSDDGIEDFMNDDDSGEELTTDDSYNPGTESEEALLETPVTAIESDLGTDLGSSTEPSLFTAAK